MGKPKFPMTAAVRFLKANQVDFNPYTYTYIEHGGTGQAAKELQVSEHRVIKTLVMETADAMPLLVLMHGDQAVSTRQFARVVGTKRISPVQADRTMNLTGYQVGGISPFGTRRSFEIYVQKTVLNLASIYVNGGKRGFLIEIDPKVLEETLGVKAVDVAV